MNGNSTETHCKTRTLVWLFGGVGSQWTEMGTDLLKIPIFHQTIERLREILKTKEIDIFQILTSKDPKTIENIQNSILGIGAIQIGLVNVLRELNIIPDIIASPSFGEVVSAYCVGCITEEQAILLAYYYGQVSLKAIDLCSAGVGGIVMPYQDVLKILPEEVDIVTKSTETCTTITGPKDIVDKLIAKLKEQNVPCGMSKTLNIAFHSRYVACFEPELITHFKAVIPEPKLRSKKWYSMTYQRKDWTNSESKLCSAEYFAHNFCNRIYIFETLKLLPPNSIVLDVSPHGQMDPFLKKNLPECNYLKSCERYNLDGVGVLRSSLYEWVFFAIIYLFNLFITFTD